MPCFLQIPSLRATSSLPCSLRCVRHARTINCVKFGVGHAWRRVYILSHPFQSIQTVRAIFHLQVLGALEPSAYRQFQQSPTFQPLLELKQREKETPVVNGFKMLQILGEGYEGKVLQVR